MVAEGGKPPAGFGLVYHALDNRVSYYAAFPLNYLWRAGLWFWWAFCALLNRESWIDKMAKRAYASGYRVGREVEKLLRSVDKESQ